MTMNWINLESMGLGGGVRMSMDGPMWLAMNWP